MFLDCSPLGGASGSRGQPSAQGAREGDTGHCRRSRHRGDSKHRKELGHRRGGRQWRDSKHRQETSDTGGEVGTRVTERTESVGHRRRSCVPVSLGDSLLAGKRNGSVTEKRGQVPRCSAYQDGCSAEKRGTSRVQGRQSELSRSFLSLSPWCPSLLQRSSQCLLKGSLALRHGQRVGRQHQGAGAAPA